MGPADRAIEGPFFHVLVIPVFKGHISHAKTFQRQTMARLMPPVSDVQKLIAVEAGARKQGELPPFLRVTIDSSSQLMRAKLLLSGEVTAECLG